MILLETKTYCKSSILTMFKLSE